MTVLTLFLGTGALPVRAADSVLNSVTQNLASTDQLVQQGTQLYEAGQFAAAVSIWQQATSAFQAEGDVLNQAMALSNLSLTYQQLGQWAEANQAITDSLNLLEFNPQIRQVRSSTGTSQGQLKILAQSLAIKGRLELSQGQAEKALTTWQQAASTYAKIGDDAGIIRSQIYQAQALQAQGLYRRALDTLQQVRTSLDAQPDSSVKTTGLRSLGNALRLVGDLDASQQVLEQSLAVARELQSPQDTSATLLSLGNTAKAQQDTQAALAYYQQAATTSPLKITRIQAQLNQLSLFLETEQDSSASGLWLKIQEQLGSLPSSRAAVEARINLAGSLIKLGSREWGSGSMKDTAPTLQDVAQLLATAVQEAKSLGDKRVESHALGQMGALYEITQQHSNAINLTQQALLLAQSINAPDIAYRWQWQLGRLLKAQGERKGAIAAYETAVDTLQSLRSDLVAINPDVQFSFREGVEPVYRELVDLLLQPPPPPPYQGGEQGGVSQENLQKARKTIESLQLAELDNFFREACLNAKAEEIDRVVDQEALTSAVFYPIILKDRLEVIIKLPNQGLRHYTAIVPQSEVEKTLEQLRQQLTEPDAIAEVKSLSQQVYDWLIKPTLADLAQNDIKTLVFVLDGSLRNVPMAALYDGKQYLVENYSVALTPGLQLIDPKPLTSRQLQALVAGVTEPRHGFSALPNVKRELDEIQSEVTSQVLFNNQFTSQALQDQINSLPFPVVHLATHGQFSSNPDETFIIAWDDRIYVKQLNDVLRNRETNEPNNAIELLVLSACQTAAGDKRAALGLAGVAVRAGARSTLASLWNVNDESTSLLMIQFYRELANKQLTKAEALRQAQLELLKTPRYQHPMFWAPYVLLGNWL